MSNQTVTKQDAQNVVLMIDVVTQRGGFKGSELAAIANIRSKFEALTKDGSAVTEASDPQLLTEDKK